MPELPKLPRISLVATAFGAVSGIVMSFLIDPLTSRIPVPLVADFIKDLVKPLLMFGVAALFAFVASRIERLDKFLNRHIGFAATLASLILPLTLWMQADAPIGFLPIATAVLVAAETYVFLLFCAYLVQQSMDAIADAQQAEYMVKREGEAQDIAMEAISEGAPDAATAIYGLNLAGEFSRAVVSGCFLFVMTGFHFFAIWVVVALSASVLYAIPVIWSIGTGLVMALAAMKTVSASMDLGHQYAHQIPVDEKYRPIRGDRDS
jgi:hypothetical protein